MINLIRLLLLVSLVAPTAKGQDSAATPLPSPTAPSDELPNAPEPQPPVDPLTSLEPPVADDPPAGIVMDIPEPKITAEEKDVADRVKVIKENNPLAPEVDSPRDRIVYLKNAGAESVQSIVKDIFGADVTTGVDPRTNVLILSGPAAKLNEALALVDKLDGLEPAPLGIQEIQKRASSYLAPHELRMGPAERRVGELLEEHRLSGSRGTGRATIDDEQEKSLREAIAAAFDERQAQQLAEIEELSARLQELSKTVRSRQAKRQQMIERRLNDLLKSQSLESDELPQPQTLESSFRGVRTEEDLFSRNPVILFFGAGDDEDSIGQIALMHRLQGQGHPVELIDVRDNPNLAARFEIQQIPTVIAVRDGAETARTVGPTTLQNLYSDIVKAADEDPLPSEDKRLPKVEERPVTEDVVTSTRDYGPDDKWVLYFRADWSAPCKEFDKTVSRLKEDGALIETIEIDTHPRLAEGFNVDVVPSLVFIREGKVHRIEGLTSYEKIRAQFDPKSHEFRPSTVIASPDSAVKPGQSSVDGINVQSPLMASAVDPVRLTEVGTSLRRKATDVLKQMKEGLVSRKALHSARKNDVQSDVKPDVRLRELEASLQGYSSQAQDIKTDVEIYLRLISQKLDLINAQLSVFRTRLQTKQKANEKLPGAFPASELEEAEAEVAKYVAEVELLKTVQEIFTTASSTATEAIDLTRPQRDVDSAPLPDPFQGPNTISSETSGNPDSKGSGSGNQSQVSPDSGIANESTESLFQSVMQLSSRAAAIKADLKGETGELRTLSPGHPRAIEVREQLNVGLAQIQAQAAEYQKFVASVANLAKTRLENARSDLDRRRQLSEQGIVPVSELRKSEDGMAEAEAAFKQLTQIQEVLGSIAAPAADAKDEKTEN
jgi:thiol-disulfide isomerase/thioredoxin